MSQSFPDAETTRGGTPRGREASEPPLSADVHVALGQVMRATVEQRARLETVAGDVSTMAREFGAMRRDLELDRGELVQGTSKHTAQKTSNRMAALLGALFVLYTEAAPVLHELWRGLHR